MFNNFGILSNINPRRAGAVAPSGYTPVASANLTSFFLSSMTNLMTQSLNKVSQQTIYLGSYGVANQPTAGDQPTINATTLNSRNVIDFAGGGDRLLSNVDFNTSSTSQDLTLCILAKRDSGLSEITSLIGQWSQSGGDFRRWKIEIDASNIVRLYSNTQFGIFDVSGSGLPITAWTAYWIVYDRLTGQNTFTYNNNVPIGAIIKSNKLDAGMGFIMGAAAPAESTTWKGSIGSVAVWNRKLTNAEKTTEIGYINTYWGLSL